MATTTLDRGALEDLTRRFTQAFNDEDLDAVMSFFADDAVYETFDDEPAKGLALVEHGVADGRRPSSRDSGSVDRRRSRY